jgi:hypothetical protein
MDVRLPGGSTYWTKLKLGSIALVTIDRRVRLCMKVDDSEPGATTPHNCVVLEPDDSNAEPWLRRSEDLASEMAIEISGGVLEPHHASAAWREYEGADATPLGCGVVSGSQLFLKARYVLKRPYAFVDVQQARVTSSVPNGPKLVVHRWQISDQRNNVISLFPFARATLNRA